MAAPENPATNFIWYARAKMLGDSVQALEFAENNRAPASTLRMLGDIGLTKAAVVAASTGNGSWAEGAIGEYRNSVNAFLESLRTRSAFYRMISDLAFTSLPMRTRLGILTQGATAWIVGEGAPTPISRMGFDGVTLEPIKAAAMVVATDELIRNLTSAGQRLFASELKGAISDEVDNVFLSTIVDSGTATFASTGNDASAAKADLRAMVLSLDLLGDPRLYFVAAPDVAARAATLTTPEGDDVFPAMSPTGGEMVRTPCVVSNAVPAGSLYLINAKLIGADSETMTIQSSNATAVQMVDNPTNSSATPTATSMVSMFQTNSTALLCTAYFSLQRLREDSVAVLTDIAWGDPV